jgi:hypothetical protein
MFWHEVPDLDEPAKPTVSAAKGGRSGSSGPMPRSSTQVRSMGTVNLERKPVDGILKPSDYMSKIAGFGMFK